jgi:predicted nucleic acid-binding protein
MIVVADSSPLHYLILIGNEDILPVLFERVAVPGAVQQELCRTGAPAAVREWMTHPPEWLEVHWIAPGVESKHAHLDPGEQQALTLAKQIHAQQILIDDLKGRIAAERDGLSVIGTVGILQRASEEALLDFGAAFRRLAATNFRMSPAFRRTIQKESPIG